MQALLVILICVLGLAVSLKTVFVLGGCAPWTSAGWWLTILYLAAVIAKIVGHVVVPAHADYLVLVGLTIAFVVAGVRDERQAEPWYWPVRRSSTRAEKRGMI
jgi:hypothetical protein